VIAAAVVLLAAGQAWRFAPLTGVAVCAPGIGLAPGQAAVGSSRRPGAGAGRSELAGRPASSVIATADTALAAAKPAAASNSQPR